jgi:hypothetical protein
MNKYNLKKNDIIIILVIFVVFCIFMYVNNYKTIEKFKIIPIKNSENYSENYSEVDALNIFLEKLIKYITKLKELNKEFFNLIEFFNENDYNPEKIFNKDNIKHFKTPLNNIKNILSAMNDINVKEDSQYLFYDFFKIHHDHIFKDYTTLFDTLKHISSGTSSVSTKTTSSGLTGTTSSGLTGTTSSGITGTTSSGLTGTTSSGLTGTTSSGLTGTTSSGSTKTTSGGSKQIVICEKTYDLNEYYVFFETLKEVKKDNLLEKLDNKVKIIDIYLNKLKSFDNYNNVMDIFSKYRLVLISVINNFNEIKNCINQLVKCNNLLKDTHNELERQFSNTDTIIDTIIKEFNTIKDSPNQNSSKSSPPGEKSKFSIDFCDKLKKLNKPDKSNVIFKRFTNDVIEQKMKYIKKLEDNIRLIQDKMTDKELNDYNLNRLRTDGDATKQYKAIKQAINNIKNKNNIKINLT